jgi:hypothetical protein
VENQLLLIPSDTYSIDTNVFIEIWCPPSAGIFTKSKMPELWDHIESLIDKGKIIASKEVYDELKRHASPELHDWLQAHKHMFVFNQAQVTAAGHIINDVYSKYKDGYKPEVVNGADPFVVATAMTHTAVVFTLEHEQGAHEPSKTNCPKIPNVCSHYGIECVNMEKFIEREGFKLSMIATQQTSAQSESTAATAPVTP